MDISFDEKSECPLSMFEYNLTGKPTLLAEIKFLSNKLTRKEQKVFEAWERNAKNDPVK